MGFRRDTDPRKDTEVQTMGERDRKRWKRWDGRRLCVGTGKCRAERRQDGDSVTRGQADVSAQHVKNTHKSGINKGRPGSLDIREVEAKNHKILFP